jgi:GNAT superfamily N-acetyltransferase
VCKIIFLTNRKRVKTNMPIRFATLQDIPSLVDGGRRMHALTRFRDQPYLGEKVGQSFAELILKGEGKYVFFVAENRDQKVVGALIGVLDQQIFSDVITASVMHYDVLPEARAGGWGLRLLRAFEQWAINRKVFELVVGVNSGEDWEKIGTFLVKMGYEKTGENFVRNQQ